jgi:hypothetical protein
MIPMPTLEIGQLAIWASRHFDASQWPDGQMNK